jgi:hypothetical protein
MTDRSTNSGKVLVRSHTKIVNGKEIHIPEHYREAPWRDHKNPEFRERIAQAEQSADKPNHGYDQQNRKSQALGRYQLTPKARETSGWIHPDGRWTEKAQNEGVYGNDKFLSLPFAQEKALDDLLDSYEAEIKAAKLDSHLGQKIDGLKAEITITEAGLVAATHRGGAKRTRQYLDKVLSPDYQKGVTPLQKEELAIEQRLREFQDVPYSFGKKR